MFGDELILIPAYVMPVEPTNPIRCAMHRQSTPAHGLLVLLNKTCQSALPAWMPTVTNLHAEYERFCITPKHS